MMMEMIMSGNTEFQISDAIEQINFVHSTFQELENLDISLPMGDYNLMYDYLEFIREILVEYEDLINPKNEED